MIAVWSSGDPDHSMDETILAELAKEVRQHPWWRARSRLVLALLGRLGVRPPSRILDAGCGWGVTLEALEARGYQASGLDVSRRALEAIDRPERRLIEADLSRDWPTQGNSEIFGERVANSPEKTFTRPGHPPEIFDTVLALDVIEHLDDDRGAVARLAQLVRPGGYLIVSVPALPELFNEFDRVQGHRRRYRPDRLRAAFEGSDLAVESVFWWGAWLVPLLGLQRRRPRGQRGESSASIYRRYLELPPWPWPWFFRLAFTCEQGRALSGRLQRGTSLFAVARRPELVRRDPPQVLPSPKSVGAKPLSGGLFEAALSRREG